MLLKSVDLTAEGELLSCTELFNLGFCAELNFPSRKQDWPRLGCDLWNSHAEPNGLVGILDARK